MTTMQPDQPQVDLPVTTMELHNAVVAKLLSTEVMYTHYVTNTLTELYQQTVRESVDSLMMIPFARLAKGMDPAEDGSDIVEAVEALAHEVALMFDLSDEEVERDMVAAVKQFPVDDVRTAAMLRSSNLLC